MSSIRLLLVEDDKTCSDVCKLMLENTGYQIITAETAEVALDLLSRMLFDVIVADAGLPGMPGTDLIKKAAAIDPTVVPIVISGMDDQDTVVRALDNGANSFLQKPFSREQFNAAIEKALTERKRIVETRMMIGDLIRTRQDLTERVAEQERTITRGELFMSHLLDAVPFGIVSTGRQGVVLTCNDAVGEIYGKPRSEIVGSDLSVLFVEAVEHCPPEGFRREHIREDGEVFPVLLHRRDIRDIEGREIAHLYVIEDLSAKEQMESQLFYAERLSLLGQLAPRIAHELKTPLQLILGHAQLSEVFLAQDMKEKALESLQRIPVSTRKTLELIQQMSNLGKPSAQVKVSLDMREELEKTLDPLSHLGVVKYCKITKDYEDPLPQVFADPAQVEQVLRNLIVNAVQAMESEKERVLMLRVNRGPGGRSVEVSVRDTGPGIPKEALDKIYDPFYTTKPEGKGTGLGLAIVRSILQRYKGGLEVSTEEGVGTCFTVRFLSTSDPEAISGIGPLADSDAAVVVSVSGGEEQEPSPLSRS